MKVKAASLSLLLAALLALASLVAAKTTRVSVQEPEPKASPSPSPAPVAETASDPGDEDVRGAFLTSRPNSVDRPAEGTTRPPRTRPRPVPTKAAPDPKPTPTSATTKTGPKKNPPKKNPPKNDMNSGSMVGSTDQKARLGLGMTLFMRDSNGLAVRVDPNHEFRKGDGVRVLLETNADGYLYIFNTTDNGAPVMIYPSIELDEAGNFIQSHVPFETPSSLAPEERLRWFEFYGNAGVERLYFVFTREPMKDVPIEDELVKFCGTQKRGCTWQPTSQLWSTLQKEMESPTSSHNSRRFGKAQTANEQEAVTRGLGLAKEDAEPTMVIMTVSSGPTMLVAALELVHK
jgi:Domain of unknown function (DUF4384)